ncbi:beta-glucosidase [Faecalicatena orotica]|uniref:beta-glucosidase n=1 Tax=Faecalicatena orotica TaxID=1544 RepID=UPI0032165D27
MNVKELIKKMTLKEKAAMCAGSDFWHTMPVERLGIPSIMVSDGPHGLRKQEEDGDHLGLKKSIEAVCFPAACATGCSFDRNLLREMGEALGKECQAEDVAILLGPGVNMKRSPLCGRNFEYFSEDPYLAGELAAAYIKGIQSQNIGTSLKHFAANNQEFERRVSSSEIDERTLREIYLPAFEIAVRKACPWTVMCSYNQVNGVQVSEDEYLLRDILKQEWGFEGFVVSDWGAVCDRVRGAAAGMDLEMPGNGGINEEAVIKAVQDKTLDEEILNDNVERILNIIFQYTENKREELFDKKKDHELAVRIAEQCIVLLKNEQVLPLKKNQEKILFVGGFAAHPRYQGGGSSNINAWKVPSFLEAAEIYADVEYVEGFPYDCDYWNKDSAGEAIKKAKESEMVIVFAGLPDSFESEGYDRTHMRLPQCQDRLIEQLCEVNQNVVVVLQNGSPVEMPWAGNVKAIVEAYLGGEGVAEAVLSILFGETNPSGRLAETFPVRLQDNPTWPCYPGRNRRADYREGIFIGYRYYDTKEMDVQFPFGHGLSYTEFKYSNLRVTPLNMRDTEEMTVSVDISNTGEYAGKEIVQLYVRDLTNETCRPDKELKGFAAVYLEPGETKTVVMKLNKRSFAWYHTGMKDWYAADGSYVVMIGKSSRQIEMTQTVHIASTKQPELTVDKTTTIGQLLDDSRTEDYVRRVIIPNCPFAENLKAGHSGKTAENLMRNWTIYSLRSFGGGDNRKIEEYVKELNQLL